jgi:RNA polymerase sporulation-specific sigma factor
MDKMDIVDLISLVREGDNLAFAELVKRYTPLINKEISDCDTHSLSVGELYAEACIGLHRAAMTYDSTRSLTFGLYAKICIYRRLVDLLRATNTLQSDFDVEKLFVTPSIDSRLAAAEHFESLMSRSKSLLSDFEYQIFVLHVQGYRTARIAEILSVSSKSVDNAKNRIFRKLREFFSDYSDD